MVDSTGLGKARHYRWIMFGNRPDPADPKIDSRRNLGANLLWRLQLKRLQSADRLRARGAIINLTCQLCESHQETIDHTFFECPYSNWVMAEALKAAGGIIPMGRITNVESVLPLLQKLSPRSCIWGLIWSLLAKIDWGLWKERNGRQEQTRRHTMLRSPEDATDD